MGRLGVSINTNIVEEYIYNDIAFCVPNAHDPNTNWL